MEKNKERIDDSGAAKPNGCYAPYRSSAGILDVAKAFIPGSRIGPFVVLPEKGKPLFHAKSGWVPQPGAPVEWANNTLGLYEQPDASVVGEKTSFLVQIPDSFNRSAPPQKEFVNKTRAKMESIFSEARWFQPFQKIPDENECRRLALEQLALVVSRASPGYPLVGEGVTTNLQIKENPQLTELVVTKFCALLRILRESGILPKPVVRIFIKQEGHKLKKTKSGALRMIWALPVEYQMLHRLIFGPSLAAELQKFRVLPIKVGFSWLANGAQSIYDSIDDGSDKIGDLDMSSWDLTVSHWLLEIERDCRWDLNLNPTDEFKHAFFQCYETLFKSFVYFSDGTMLSQEEPGIVRSGSLLTISGNSKMQVILKVLFCEMTQGGYDPEKHCMIAQGDDTLGRMHGISANDIQKWFVSHGFKAKEMTIGKMIDKTFCSHNFKKFENTIVPVPTNWTKHQFALSWKEPSKTQFFAEQCFSLMLEYCFVPDVFDQLRKIVADLKPKYAFSARYFQAMMLGFENALCPIPKEFVRDNLVGDPLCETLVQSMGMKLENACSRAKVELRRKFLVDFLLSIKKTFGAPIKAVEEFISPVVSRFGDTIGHADDLVVGFKLASKAHLAHAVLLNEIHSARHKSTSYKPSPNQGKDTRPRKRIEGFLHSSQGETNQIRPRLALLEERIAPLDMATRNLKSVLNNNSTKKAAVVGKRAFGVAKAAIKISAKHAAQKGHARTKVFVPPTMKSPSGSNNSEAGHYKGKELLTTLMLSGASQAALGKDVPGTLLYSVQLRPQQMIPNQRLGKLMSLYVKWRGRIKITFESALPSGTNAGDLLFVHEPDPLEVVPIQFAAPVGGVLSNYDSHSYKKMLPMAKSSMGPNFPGLQCSSSAAQGTQGGWFLIDQENEAPLLDSSMGWFLIFVQNQHNIIGGGSQPLPTTTYPAGNLFIEYDLMVQSASDNGSSLGGGYSLMQTVLNSGTGSYANPGNTTQSSAGQTFFPVPSVNTGWVYLNNESGVKMQVSSITPGTQENWQFPEAGVYLVTRGIALVSGNYSDMGTTESRYTATASGTGAILDARSFASNSSTTGAFDSNAVGHELTISIDNPATDFLQYVYAVGTGGSATATALTYCKMRVVSLPPDTVQRFRKQRAEEKKEMKLLTDMRPKLEKLFAAWKAEPQPSCDVDVIVNKVVDSSREMKESTFVEDLSRSQLIDTLKERNRSSGTDEKYLVVREPTTRSLSRPVSLKGT